MVAKAGVSGVFSNGNGRLKPKYKEKGAPTQVLLFRQNSMSSSPPTGLVEVEAFRYHFKPCSGA
jgi:hypothetical protein